MKLDTEIINLVNHFVYIYFEVAKVAQLSAFSYSIFFIVVIAFNIRKVKYLQESTEETDDQNGNVIDI